jgi:heme oxygenase (mycobilin-producing)
VSIVKINVIEVPEGRGEVLEQRFAARAGEVEKVDGFESFELLRPTEGTDRYLVVTRWRDEAAFQAWLTSDAFTKGHAASREDAAADATPAAGHPHGHGGGHPGGAPHAGGAPGGAGGHGGGQPGGGPAAVGSELWGFEIVTSATGTSS